VLVVLYLELKYMSVGCLGIEMLDQEQELVGPKKTKNRPKRGLIFVTARAPGRGVLRFLARGYRRPVHFLAIFAFFTEN